MKDTPKFPADLPEHDRRLMVNALMIVGGQFGPTKNNTKDGLWTQDHNAIVEKLGVKPRWGVESTQRKCEHGCAPAFLEGERAESCWKCGEEALNEKLLEAIASAARGQAREAQLQAATTELLQLQKEAAARIAALEAQLVDKNESLQACFENDKTEYDYQGEERLNRNGKKAPVGQRWLTPREIARASLQT